MNDKIYDIEINKEKRGLENDKHLNVYELQSHQMKYAEMLKSDMGKDMKAVLNGDIKVKLTWKEKLNRFINKLFQAI